MRKNPSSRDKKPGGDRPYKKDTGSGPRSGDKKPYPRGESNGKPYNKPKRSFDNKEDDRPKRPYGTRDNGAGKDGERKRPYGTRGNGETGRFEGSDRPKRSYGDRDDKPRRDFDNNDRPRRSFDKKDEDRPKRSYGDRDDKPRRDFDKDKPKRSFGDKGNGKPRFTKPEDDPFDKPFPLGTRKVSGPFRKQFEKEQQERAEKPYKGRRPKGDEAPQEPKEMTLNKYIAHSGQCSRRDAAEMVKQGKVKVNGELALDPGYRVQPFDIVTIAGKKLTPQKGRIYILLNKPKDYITTTDDPEGRRTIMDLVNDPDLPRLFPVGRLDRNTTGLILLTNDGDLAQKLSHPSYDIKKVYQVTLNKPLTKAHFEQIVAGLTLEDGEVHVDALAYLEEKNELGLEIHSGRNRIVRRIFESLGYEVEKLDRMMYAGLTKKNLPRGQWRQLEEKEVIMLKHFKS